MSWGPKFFPKGLWFLMLLGVFAWWVRYHPPGVDLLVFDDDARQHVYWTARFQDPELFQQDLLTDFISSPMMDPPGYQLIYRLGTTLLEPLALSQLMSLVLLLLSLWFLELLSRPLIPEQSGRFFLQLLFLFFSLYDSSGGFPRGFAFPLLLGFLALQQRGAMGWGGLVLVLEALVYPPILLNTLAMAGVWGVGELRRRGWNKELARKGIFLAAGCGVAMIILLWVYAPSGNELFGPQVGVQQARGMPEFQEGGRSAFFQENPLKFLFLGRSGIGLLHLVGFGIILAGMVGSCGLRVLRVPAMAVHLCWTSMALFVLAHMLLFRLHLPSRYTLYTLPLAFMLVIGASTGPFLAATQGAWAPLAGFLGRNRRGWGLLAGVLVAYAWAQGHLIVQVDTQMAVVDRTEREMLEFLKGLPKSALVAAHPVVANNVPLVARRKVLANEELSLPYQMGYYTQVRQRLLDLFEAYYARNWGEIEEFARKHDIAALVADKTHFSQTFLQGRIYFEPFGSLVRKRLEHKGGFALMAPPRERVCFENHRYLVICWDRGENR